MSTQLNYPGVYVEEVPSGVHTITGVATSIAAFVGWAPKGPTDHAELILSMSDFDRKFGGLNVDSVMSYAVYQFFSNGGKQAYIVRLVKDAASASIPVDPLKITAKNEGDWANSYWVSTKQRSDDNKRFQLAVSIKSNDKYIVVESFDNLSSDPLDPRYVVDIVNAESSIINVENPPGNTAAPANTDPINLAGGLPGTKLKPNDPDFEEKLDLKGSKGVHLLEKVNLFNILCIPGETKPDIMKELESFCQNSHAFLLIDCDRNIDELIKNGPIDYISGTASSYAAIYYPWITSSDPLSKSRIKSYPPCGYIAGIYARTDSERGVWKAPAGIDAGLIGSAGVAVQLNDQENGLLNVQAINCIRNFNVYGIISWGARTLIGSDERGDQWKYIPVRRTALFIEESLVRGLKWVVFEPNDEPLWSQIRLNVGSFMQDLFRKGAFQGQTPKEAYFVKCDKETTTQYDIDRGIVNILVGFAPLKPAEFVVIKLQQMAGQAQTE